MSNSSIIQMHLYEYLRETGQYGNVDWSAVLGFCLGYYGQITEDHIHAIMALESSGALIAPNRASGR